MVLNVTFNNMWVISWRSVLLVEEIGVPGKNHRLVASHWQTLWHNVVWSTPRHELGSNSQHQWWYRLIAQAVNPTTIRSRPRWPHIGWYSMWYQRLIFIITIPQNETTQQSKLLWRNIYFSLLIVINIPSISYGIHWWKQTEIPAWKSKDERRVPRSSEEKFDEIDVKTENVRVQISIKVKQNNRTKT